MARKRKLDLPGWQQTEVWVRNPKLCVRECRDVGQRNIVFYTEYARESMIDPAAFLRTFYGPMPWRCLEADRKAEVVLEYNSDGSDRYSPHARHYYWNFSSFTLDELDEMMNKAADNGRYVFVTGLPVMSDKYGQGVLNMLAEIQHEFPTVRMHISNIYSFTSLFSPGFGSVDIEPRVPASCGDFTLPNGFVIRNSNSTEVAKWAPWLKMMGFKPEDMKVPRNRCMMTIMSARWAGINYRVNKTFRVRGFAHNPEDVKEHRAFFRSHPPQPGDMFYCGKCSMAEHCRFFREGSVCSVPGTDGERLAELFATRNGDSIIEALSELTSIQARRIQAGMEHEHDHPDEGLDPHVSKLVESTFKMGVDLGKLIDPNRFNPKAPGTQNNTQVNILSGGDDAKKLTADIVRALNAAGVETQDITPQMIEQVMRSDPSAFDATIQAIAETAGS